MPERAVFTVEVDAELRDRFMAEAEAVERPASQLLGELMREFVERQRQARDYDAWFRAEVEQGLREADDPNVPCIPNEEVMASLHRKCAEWARKIDGRTG